MTPNMQVDPNRDPDRLFLFTLRLFLDLATREVQEHDVRMRDAETEYWYEFGPEPTKHILTPFVKVSDVSCSRFEPWRQRRKLFAFYSFSSAVSL